ncbi:MAG: hypothetical protein VXX85_03955, partial [Candidatus Margulisiibacteriota bacterium]|nr:hypothetical protein [Candidatus Margulisiibacteriota bacterium]
MKHFNIKKLLSDQRIIKAKELINETIEEYQDLFLKSQTYNLNIKKKLNEAAKLRGGKLFFPYISSGIGKGSKI